MIYRNEEELDPGSSLDERIANTVMRLACQPEYADRLLYWGGPEYNVERDEEIICLFMTDVYQCHDSRIAMFSAVLLDLQNIGNFVMNMRTKIRPIQEHHRRLNHAAAMAPIMEVHDD